jgi:hypothetical protein
MAKIFGDNYIEFDNSEDLRVAPPEVVKKKKDEMLDVFKRIKEFVGKPPATPESKEWVANELNKKDTLAVPKDGEAVTPPHPDHGAAEEAKKLGLTYFGFGRWGKNGVVTHHSVHDSLVEVTKDKPKDVNMPLVGTSSGTPKAKAPVKEDLDTEFDSFLTEAVTITVKADTAEEAAKAVRLLTSEGDEPDEVEEQVQVQNTFSDLTAKQLLTLGQTFGIHESKKPDNFLKDANGKVRVFMVRRSAAAEAHQKDGEVVKSERGYVIKLKENVNVQSNFKPIQETSTSASTGRSLITESRDCECTTSAETRTEDTGCGCETSTEKTTSTSKAKSKTIAEAKANWSKTKSASKEEVKEAIDANTEAGMSLSGASKEKLDKDGKVTMTELTGDETTMSIGDQKEDELKKVGISLSSFKAKKVV